jgi:hypothetical protein
MKHVIFMAGVLLGTTFTRVAADRPRNPSQILGGNPAAVTHGSSGFYNGHGAYVGRTSTSDTNTSIYDAQGRYSGRVETVSRLRQASIRPVLRPYDFSV